jgi:hypothetical protein
VKDNLTATAPPSVTDDNTQGYAVGSLWVDTTSDSAFLCANAATGAAVWIDVGGTQSRNSPVYGYGTPLDYTASGSVSTSDVQYVRVFLNAGVTLASMTSFYRGGGAAARLVRMGIYDQADPLSLTDVPRNKVAETASTSSGGWTANSYPTLPLLSSYTVPSAGFYWFALIQGASQINWSVTPVFPPGQVPLYFEASTGVTLPATAGTLTTATSAVALCGALE